MGILLRSRSISRCLGKPDFLDDASARRRTHEKTDFLSLLRSGILVMILDTSDVVVSQLLLKLYTFLNLTVAIHHEFPQADIENIVSGFTSPSYKGTFKVSRKWVNEYLIEDMVRLVVWMSFRY